MTDEDETSMLGDPSPEMLDAVYLSATQDALATMLSRAKFKLSYFRKDICGLASEPSLPEEFRAAYGRMVSLLDALDLAFKRAEKKNEAITPVVHRSIMRQRRMPEPAPSPALVAAAEEVICRINDAQNRLVKVVQSAKSALLNHADQSLIDWTMPYDCEFELLLKPGPTRTFYNTCCDGEEPMRVGVRFGQHDMSKSGDSSFNDPAENFNVFRSFYGDSHPLSHGHHGYIVHCLFDHMYFPWELLPHIQELEVTYEYRDCETLWAASPALPDDAPPPVE